MAHTIEYGGDVPTALALVAAGLAAEQAWFVELVIWPAEEPTVRGRLIATRKRDDDALIDLCIAITDDDGLVATGEERWIPADHISKLIVP